MPKREDIKKVMVIGSVSPGLIFSWNKRKIRILTYLSWKVINHTG